jgi:CGNR zinc finger/Putative stress-induced transcription regulator
VDRVTHVLPDWLAPVLAFINSVDVETGVDELAAGPPALGDWLAGRGLLAGGPAPTHPEYRLALDLRTGLRALALVNNAGPADAEAVLGLRKALDRLPLTAVADDDGQVLRPHRLAPVPAALAVIVAGYVRAVAGGQWRRIRRCPAEDCAWAFWDSSAKGTRRWCTMRVCGNRAKARAFAQRRGGNERGRA